MNRKTWTVTAQSIHTSKDFINMPCGSPYVHHAGGAGIHHMPEVGAHCYVASPNDNTPPFVLCYLGMPGIVTTEDSDPLVSTTREGSLTDASYQANRPDLNPGDLAFNTRDGNFVILRRGGVVQIGASGICQTIYVPVRNMIRQFAENYEMATPIGDVAWTVEREELDSSGKAAGHYAFHLREFASDAAASVRVRHLPLQAPGGGSKASWEVTVAPQGINPDTGAASGVTYSLLVAMDGTKTELVGANRTVTVTGDDSLTVEGNQAVSVTGSAELDAETIRQTAVGSATLDGARVELGADAIEPALLGNAFMQWIGTAVFTVSGTTATLSPASLLALQKVLSSKVFVK